MISNSGLHVQCYQSSIEIKQKAVLPHDQGGEPTDLGPRKQGLQHRVKEAQDDDFAWNLQGKQSRLEQEDSKLW